LATGQYTAVSTRLYFVFCANSPAQALYGLLTFVVTG